MQEAGARTAEVCRGHGISGATFYAWKAKFGARATLVAWRKDYNTERPHPRLGWQTPASFAQTFTPQWGLTLRNPQSSAPAPFAQPAQTGLCCTNRLRAGVPLSPDRLILWLR